jgi:CopA family copper-resistance protein
MTINGTTVFLSLFFGWLVLGTTTQAKTYSLDIRKTSITLDGKSSPALSINGTVPAPTLYVEEGEAVTIHVTNNLQEDTSLHWHGLLVPPSMDGVPSLNGFNGIKPHTTFTYRFTVRQTGTYWYHAHSHGQEQQGLYGAIVIYPKGETHSNNDDVIVLSEHTTEHPDTIMRHLKSYSGYYNDHKRTVIDFWRDVQKNGFKTAIRDRLDWGNMRMDPTDLADVSDYTFLINGKTAKDNWTTLYTKGTPKKLRFINASAMSFFDVFIPHLTMTVVAMDGMAVQPVVVDEFRLGVGETVDVMVMPKDETAYTIMAQSMDRTGYARGTLAPYEGMTAPIPPMRPRTYLTMADMGDMDMSHMDMADMNNAYHREHQKG